MRPLEVVTSLTFRYIAIYVTVLSATVFLLLGGLYAYFSYTFFSDLSDSILDELETLQLVYSGQSLTGVQQYIDDQITAPASGRFYYLVTDAAGNRVAGDLRAAPRYQEFTGGWLGFQLALLEWGETVDADFLARPSELGEGYRAIVARNYVDAAEQVTLVFSTLFRAMLATVLLGTIGGYFSAASTLNRVERLNRDLSRVIRGSPDRRIDTSAHKGYVRQLAGIMNDLLGQTETLMQGVKTVSDNIAHDLRTPLTRMRNQLEQLRSGLDGARAEDLQRIIADCDEILATFNALLRISNLETSGQYSGTAETDLAALLSDVVELYEPLAVDKGLSITLELPGKAALPGDRDLLFQLFANLLDNAIKYTPAGGEIAIELVPLSGPGWRVLVCDSGPGIPVAERKNVFRRFYRLEASRGREPGHGLGLSLVQAIAHYHRGTVELLDNEPGLRIQVDFA